MQQLINISATELITNRWMGSMEPRVIEATMLVVLFREKCLDSISKFQRLIGYLIQARSRWNLRWGEKGNDGLL
jgi:hypothetical protein